jgi:hypothetical protein
VFDGAGDRKETQAEKDAKVLGHKSKKGRFKNPDQIYSAKEVKLPQTKMTHPGDWWDRSKVGRNTGWEDDPMNKPSYFQARMEEERQKREKKRESKEKTDYFVEEIRSNIIYHNKILPIIGMIAGQAARGIGGAAKKIGPKLFLFLLVLL